MVYAVFSVVVVVGITRIAGEELVPLITLRYLMASLRARLAERVSRTRKESSGQGKSFDPSLRLY